MLIHVANAPHRTDTGACNREIKSPACCQAWPQECVHNNIKLWIPAATCVQYGDKLIHGFAPGRDSMLVCVLFMVCQMHVAVTQLHQNQNQIVVYFVRTRGWPFFRGDKNNQNIQSSLSECTSPPAPRTVHAHQLAQPPHHTIKQPTTQPSSHQPASQPTNCRCGNPCGCSH